MDDVVVCVINKTMVSMSELWTELYSMLLYFEILQCCTAPCTVHEVFLQTATKHCRAWIEKARHFCLAQATNQPQGLFCVGAQHVTLCYNTVAVQLLQRFG